MQVLFVSDLDGKIAKAYMPHCSELILAIRQDAVLFYPSRFRSFPAVEILVDYHTN